MAEIGRCIRFQLPKHTNSTKKTLYSSDTDNNIAQQEMLNTYAIPLLSEQARNSCNSAITENEFFEALKLMKNNKSPEIDGLTTNFYKHFWNLFGTELTTIYNHAFTTGTLSVTQCHGLITLLYKKGDRSRLKNRRPITLLTTDYTILTKALANHLKNVLPQLIHTDQTACIPGRTINDNISLIRDALNFANKTNAPLPVISIDQLKAFDRVSHAFLHATLEKFGSSPHFRRWINTIYNSVSSSVKVNGWVTSFIPLKRGLRQVCALSMPLYILTAEIMAIHIRSNPEIKGLRLPENKQEVKLSQYTDDTTLLLRDDKCVKQTFNTLTLYEHASGTRVNKDKCKGLWCGALTPVQIDYITLIG